MGLVMIELVINDGVHDCHDHKQELRRLIPLYGPIRLFQIKNKASRDKEVTLLSE